MPPFNDEEGEVRHSSRSSFELTGPRSGQPLLSCSLGNFLGPIAKAEQWILTETNSESKH